jgi:hypothetical protein
MLHWWVLIHTLAHGILHHKIWASERAAAASNNNNNNRKEHLLPTCQLLSTSRKFYKHVIDNIIQHNQKIWLESAKASDLVPCNKGTKMEFRALSVFIEDVSESLRNKTNEVTESKKKMKMPPTQNHHKN